MDMNKWAVAGFIFGLACLTVAGYVVYLASQQQGIGGVTEQPAPTVSKAPDAAPAPVPAPAPAPAPAPTPAPAPADAAAAFTPANITLVRSIPADAYVPGQPVDVTLIVNKAGTEQLMAIGIKEEIPAGWTFDQVLTQDLSKPSIQRAVGSVLEFAWIDIPQFPLTLTYRVNTAAEPQEVTLSGEALVRTNGPEISSGVVRSLVRPGTEAEIAAAARTAAAAAAAAPAPAPAPAAAAAPVPAATPTPPVPPVQTQQAPPQRQAVQGLPRTMRVTHAFDTAGYTAGQPFDVTVSLQYNGQEDISNLALQVALPEGWGFASASGDPAPAGEGVNEEGVLALSWPTAPAWPVTCTLHLTAPEDATGDAILRSEAQYLVQQLSQEMTSGKIGVAIPLAGS
jgi:hypothetical protein